METLYLKYRPKKFGDLIWQDHVKRLFANAISSGEISHSYLFSGPRGTGKTSTARILAKSLNCEKPIDGYEPCNECESCKVIDSGKSMDVVEMDAASNRGIDEIRAIRDRVAYLPIESKYKVYIIDEVHMLTKEAFNALLKTLEEPPKHTIFILATTEIQKVPDTVVSRCQVVEFRRIPVEFIKDHLVKICKMENMKFETEALEHIAKKSMGALRDAIGLLEEIARFSAGNVTLKDTLFVLGEVPIETVEEYVSSLSSGNAESLLRLMETIEENGIDPMNFAQETLEFVTSKLPDPVIAKIGKFVSDLIQRLKFEEKQFDTFKVLSVFEALNDKGEILPERSVLKVPKAEKAVSVKTDVDRLIDWYAKEGDMSVFACLAMSIVKDFGDRILVISKIPLHHELLKEKSKTIEMDFKRITSRDVKFVSAYSEIPIENIEPEIRESLVRTLSISGGKLLKEGGGEIV